MVIFGEIGQNQRLNILELIEESHSGRLERYEKGDVLFWQGEPGEYAFVIKKGKVKIYPISDRGKSHTYDIAGAGRLVGASALLLGSNYHSMAEALENTDIYVITQAEFEHFLADSSPFSMAVMRELAQTVQLLADQVEELSLLNVHNRLERCLARLAEQYGVINDDGIKIDLGVTHQELADMIAANRSTVTFHLNKLKQEGLLWSRGRHLYLTLPEHVEVLQNIKASVVEYDRESAEIWAKKAVELRVDPLKALDALSAGIRQVDDGYALGALGLPEIMGAAVAMERALPIIVGEMANQGGTLKALGTVVIGTVHGDIHDIGKTMVSTLLTGEGFHVIDLGVDVSRERFVTGTQEHLPEIIAISALMSTTAPEIEKIVKDLREDEIGSGVKVMVGGGAITRQLAVDTGADGYAPTARRAVEMARRLVGARPRS